MYIKEVGVIYYLGDPKGPCLQEGLSEKEALKKAIENFDLDRKSTRLNSSHPLSSRMPSSA